jgi:hypothetical protein
LQDEHIKEIHNMIEMEDDGTEAKFKQLFEQVQQGKKQEVTKTVCFSHYCQL